VHISACERPDGVESRFGLEPQRAVGRQRLHELQQEFDYVLIDAPSLSQSNAAIMLGSATNGAVLVLKANSSRREVARKAMDDLKAANVNFLGAVLNQRTFPIPEPIYKRL